jgi:hypothetical protein
LAGLFLMMFFALTVPVARTFAFDDARDAVAMLAGPHPAGSWHWSWVPDHLGRDYRLAGITVRRRTSQGCSAEADAAAAATQNPAAPPDRWER